MVSPPQTVQPSVTNVGVGSTSHKCHLSASPAPRAHGGRWVWTTPPVSSVLQTLTYYPLEPLHLQIVTPGVRVCVNVYKCVCACLWYVCRYVCVEVCVNRLCLYMNIVFCGVCIYI